MGKWKRRPAARTSTGPIARTRADFAEAGAQAEALLGRKVLVRATRPDQIQNADIIDELITPCRERLGWPMDIETNRLLGAIAMQAWNVSRTSASSPDAFAELEEMLRMAPVLEAVVRDMFARAREMYPADRRLFTGVSIEIRDALLQIRAASIGSELTAGP